MDSATSRRVRSSRHVRVELEGVVLAESRPPVLVFETGLPARFYFDRSAVGCDDHVLVAFYDEPVDVVVDGVRQDRPRGHFFG